MLQFHSNLVNFIRFVIKFDLFVHGYILHMGISPSQSEIPLCIAVWQYPRAIADIARLCLLYVIYVHGNCRHVTDNHALDIRLY